VSGQQDQVQKYARQLATQEGELAGLRDQLSDLKKKRAAQESSLNALIEALDF
jgi:septal ring factor EnvC (AmiA/AmiB activator)